jgi:hypothetical protein
VCEAGAFARQSSRQVRERCFQKISVDRYWNAIGSTPLGRLGVVIWRYTPTGAAPAICGQYSRFQTGMAGNSTKTGPDVCEMCCSNCTSATFYYSGPKQAGTRRWGQPDAATAPAGGVNVITADKSTPASSPLQVPWTGGWWLSHAIRRPCLCSCGDAVCTSNSRLGLCSVSLAWLIACFSAPRRHCQSPRQRRRSRCQNPGSFFCACSWRAAQRSLSRDQLSGAAARA